MKKIFLSFLIFPVIFVWSTISASACYGCRNYSPILAYHYYTPSLHCSSYLTYNPTTVSAPIYSAYTIYNNRYYLIFCSDAAFTAHFGFNTGGDISCSDSGGERPVFNKQVFVSVLDYVTADSPLSMEFNDVSLDLPKYIPDVNVNDTNSILALDKSLFTLAVNSDGTIAPPAPPFDPASDAHDFSKDVYDPDLSVPVLSNVSYTGFNIENPDSKEWQVVVDVRVYGLKWNPSYTDPMLLTNTNYTVNHQVWNFAEHPDKLSLNGRFDVYDNFGVSTYDWFVSQVRQYANDVHPSDYPNYSFLKVGIKTGWNTFLDYIKDIGSDEAENPDGAGHRFEQNIYRSRMCQVTYYVRFVEYDVDGSPHYSRWMAYTLKPSQDVLVEGENFSRGNVEFGEVSDVDPVTGRPVVSDKESLKYNTSTGEYEYYDPLSNQGFQFEMNDVFGYLSGLKESVMGFADLIAYCFSFLPSWVSQFISYSLVVAISFSVIRLIRG